MEMKILRNGLKTSSNRKRKSRKRRNPATATAKPVARKRNGVSKTSVASYAKKNGLKLVKKSAANPKRKRSRKRRNGLAVVKTRNNGFFGNTKQDAKQVLALGAGAIGTKFVGNLVNGFISPYAASFGVGSYTDLIADGMVAIVVTPYVARMIGGNEAQKMARLGGLLIVALDVINKFFPQVNVNPFNNAPIVINSSGQALLTANGATDLASAAGANPAVIAKMAGAINAVGASNNMTYQNTPVMSVADSGDGW